MEAEQYWTGVASIIYAMMKDCSLNTKKTAYKHTTYISI